MRPNLTLCPNNLTSRQDEMFTLLSAILWLGNVRLKPIKRGTGDDTVEVLAGPALSTAARLLGVPEAALVKALSKRNISAGAGLRHLCRPSPKWPLSVGCSTEEAVACSGCQSVALIILRMRPEGHVDG
jgi:myosin heavy subunit